MAAGARGAATALWREQRIEVLVIPFADWLWVRVSAQLYNDADDFARLAAALRSRPA